jgi:predicted O-linked N-acetylglucosamine transferase (SPINDLY family)
LPVLTCKGTAYAGRVAASLLLTSGLSELVTETAQDYQTMALKLAREPVLLQGLRDRLTAQASPLFDTARFARNIEEAYLRMLAS